MVRAPKIPGRLRTSLRLKVAAVEAVADAITDRREVEAAITAVAAVVVVLAVAAVEAVDIRVAAEAVQLRNVRHRSRIPALSPTILVTTAATTFRSDKRRFIQISGFSLFLGGRTPRDERDGLTADASQPRTHAPG